MTDINLTAEEIATIIVGRAKKLINTAADDHWTIQKLAAGIRQALDLYEEQAAIEGAEFLKHVKELKESLAQPSQPSS